MSDSGRGASLRPKLYTGHLQTGGVFMSTSIENLRRLAQMSLKDHIGVFDFYVTVGRDIETLSLKFGMDPPDVIHLLEGYGEKIQTENGLDFSGKGRLSKLSRLLVDEYIEHFYPGIASENPQNDWICIEAYLDLKHPGWR